jgi:hypothetical protein
MMWDARCLPEEMVATTQAGDLCGVVPNMVLSPQRAPYLLLSLPQLYPVPQLCSALGCHDPPALQSSWPREAHCTVPAQQGQRSESPTFGAFPRCFPWALP